VVLELKELELRQGSFAMKASFDVDPAVRIAVIGPSGAGKSTLLMALAGFLQPSAGRLEWDGFEITKQAPSARPFSRRVRDPFQCYFRITICSHT